MVHIRRVREGGRTVHVPSLSYGISGKSDQIKMFLRSTTPSINGVVDILQISFEVHYAGNGISISL